MTENNDLMVLQWELQPSGVWTGTSGSTVVAMVGPDACGRFEWRLRIVSGPVAPSSGKEVSAASARAEADKHWSAWLAAHGLAPREVPPTNDAAALQAAVSAYRRHKDMVMEQDAATNDMVLVRTILEVHASSLSMPGAMDDATVDDILLRHYMAAQEDPAPEAPENVLR